MSSPDQKDLFSSTHPLESRRIALELFQSVVRRKRALDQVLEESEALARLDARDRSFVRMLLMTALRRLGQVDDLLRQTLDKPDSSQPDALRDILRLAVVQICFLAVADHAAVSTAVDLTERAGFPRLKGLVNAVLRRLATHGKAWSERQDAVRLNIPGWLFKTWEADYGAETAAEIGLALLAEAPLDLTVKSARDAEFWAKALDAKLLPTGSVRRSSGGAVTALTGFEDGVWWVQDAASALPVRLFPDLSGQTVLDLCAAPGGKTMQLAAAGANVVAIDRSASRLKRLGANLGRVGLGDRVAVLAADATAWTPPEPARFVLLDAPCSATGTIRRHPDILHLRSAKDLESLIQVQERMLDAAARMVAPGGVLIYCTCSLQKDEGERQIERFLSRHGSVFARDPVRGEEIGQISGTITEAGDVRILPSHLAALGGMDGFFISRLVRR